jgi:hypothetical protein
MQYHEFSQSVGTERLSMAANFAESAHIFRYEVRVKFIFNKYVYSVDKHGPYIVYGCHYINVKIMHINGSHLIIPTGNKNKN